MKNLFKIFTLLILVSCKAQTTVSINTYNIGDNSNKYFKDLENNSQNFVGTWENLNNDMTFRVIIWKKHMDPLVTEQNSYMDRLYGRFLIIQNAGLPNENIVHDSVKYFAQSNNISNWSLFGSPYYSYKYEAYFLDTCASGGNGVLEGTATMVITDLTATPFTAVWTVKSALPFLSGEYFSVPNNIVLTKIN